MTGLKLRVFAGGRWHQATFRPPWEGRPVTDWLVAQGHNVSRVLYVEINGRWYRKSGANSEVLHWERTGQSVPK
jgi:hypothetical protein